MLIPKSIFQTARDFGGLSDDYKKNIAHLKALNPSWSYRFFNDEEVRAYIRANVSPEEWALVQQINPKYGVVLADIFRYLVICNEGGVYLDIKSTALRPLDEIIPADAQYLISQWPNKLGQRFRGFGLHPELTRVPGGEFQQWHVIGSKGHPFLKAVLNRVFENLRNYTPKSFGTDAYGVLRLSGPIAYTKAIFPLLEACPHTVVDPDQIGLRYSIYEETADIRKHEKHAQHYSLIKEPIVLKDVYVEPPMPVIQSLGEMLAVELRENTELVLKLAVASVAAVLGLVIGLPVLIIWLVHVLH